MNAPINRPRIRAEIRVLERALVGFEERASDRIAVAAATDDHARKPRERRRREGNSRQERTRPGSAKPNEVTVTPVFARGERVE